ncbi:hypothetical protein HMPREF1986_02347 [Oribacterium sp. oral taxon 078 str. F0263]|nr:hypothetical protein HMPREF1986_02347 [Oribacterium sp. oral taxon 078 str. F0263]
MKKPAGFSPAHKKTEPSASRPPRRKRGAAGSGGLRIPRELPYFPKTAS